MLNLWQPDPGTRSNGTPRRHRVRFYSLFTRRRGTRRWKRVADLALPKTQAVVWWQKRLRASSMGLTNQEYRLRPI